MKTVGWNVEVERDGIRLILRRSILNIGFFFRLGLKCYKRNTRNSFELWKMKDLVDITITVLCIMEFTLDDWILYCYYK